MQEIPFGEGLALQPWLANPYRLVSWWDMQQFSARAFYLIGKIIPTIGTELVNDALAPNFIDESRLNVSITDSARQKALRSLESIDEYCESIGLHIAAETVRDLEESIREKPLSYSTVVIKMNDLADVIYREMHGRMFMYIPAERARFYGAASLFGDKVSANFKSAAFDITEAGNCLAAARGTACVFHLMRVLEIGLTALGNVFGVSLAHTNWGPAIDECEKKIRNMNQDPKWKILPDWKDQQEFYSQVISYLGVAKDAWRNYTAHARGKYTEEEADLMLRNIRAFMQKLAERLEE